MGDSSERLIAARERAGFKSARAAALRYGWKPSTYASHENGQTPEVPPSAAKKYAKAFKVSPAWIITGEGGTPPLGIDEMLKGATPEIQQQAIAIVQILIGNLE